MDYMYFTTHLHNFDFFFLEYVVWSSENDGGTRIKRPDLL